MKPHKALNKALALKLLDAAASAPSETLLGPWLDQTEGWRFRGFQKLISKREAQFKRQQAQEAIRMQQPLLEFAEGNVTLRAWRTRENLERLANRLLKL